MAWYNTTHLITPLRHAGIGFIVMGCVLLQSMFNGSAGGQALAAPPAPSGYPLVTAGANGISIDWRTPQAQIVQHADGSIGVLYDNYAQSAQPGAPVLPYMAVLVAVPPGALPALHVTVVEVEELALTARLALAPRWALAPLPAGVLRNAAGDIIGGDFAPAAATQAYTDDPDAAITLAPAGVARGVHLARLMFHPARLLGSGPQTRLRLTSHVRLTLTFSEPAVNRPGAAASDPFLAALRAAVINPAHAAAFSAQIQDPLAEEQPQFPHQTAGPAWGISVSAPGMTVLTYEALAGAGFPVAGSDPQRLRLAHGATEIAAEWDGDGDASFEPGERLLFYANPRFSRWQAGDVYRLWQDTSPTLALRMQTRPATPNGQPLGPAWVDQTNEINRLYTPDCFCGSIPAGRDGDHWAWDDLKRPGQSSRSYTFNLPTLDVTQPATLTVWLIGYTNLSATPDHRVDVQFNGAALGRIEWDGKQAITATLPLPPGSVDSSNTLALTLPGMPGVSIEGVWLDGFSIRYARGSTADGSTAGGSTADAQALTFTGQPAAHTYQLAFSAGGELRAYDITQPEQPLRLSGVTAAGSLVSLSDPAGGGAHRYAVTTDSGLQAPAGLRPLQSLQSGAGFSGADYVIISHSDFIPALAALRTLRQAQGLTVAIEDVQAIYDTYSAGRPDPEAIRAYLAHAYAAWALRPVYVVLVGDGSFDPRQYRATSPPGFIPPYLADVDPWAGETAADNRFVTVDGPDALPDMLIGRLPVKTLAEAQSVVNKIVQYENTPLAGDWNRTLAFVADNADSAGNFAATSELIAANYVPAQFTAQRIYYTPPTPMAAEMHQAVVDRTNAGALIIQFSGHSSWQQWAGERFLHLNDLPALHNQRRWPIVVAMTCFTSSFHRPEATLDEHLLTLNDSGAVATWGATGLGVSTGHDSLNQGFFQAVFSDPSSSLGQAAWAGKLSLAAGGQNLDLLDTFTLLGDPALKPNLSLTPWASHTYLPVISNWHSPLER